jgi:hypothetical protein
MLRPRGTERDAERVGWRVSRLPAGRITSPDHAAASARFVRARAARVVHVRSRGHNGRGTKADSLRF